MLKTVGNPSTRSGDQTILNGNLVIGTAGNGIDFSADPSAAGMTSELLDDYEEGTWTPTGDGITLASASGRYTKIGDTVHLFFEVVFPTTANTGGAQINGVPFSASTNYRNGAALGLAVDSGSNYTLVAVNTLIQIYNRSGGLTTNANNSDKQYYGVITYKI